jgi:hypothetical protein
MVAYGTGPEWNCQVAQTGASSNPMGNAPRKG